MITEPPAVDLDYVRLYDLDHALRVYGTKYGVDAAGDCVDDLRPFLNAAYDAGRSAVPAALLERVVATVRETAFAVLPSDPETAAMLSLRLNQVAPGPMGGAPSDV